MKKLQVPTGPSTGRIVCPKCSNDHNFFEVAKNVTVTSKYEQNDDGSFTPVDSDMEMLGEVRFYCGECEADLSRYHSYFLEMIF